MTRRAPRHFRTSYIAPHHSVVALRPKLVILIAGASYAAIAGTLVLLTWGAT
jgi:hypothetical protein